MNTIFLKLDANYDPDDLNPVWTKPGSDNNSVKGLENIVSDLPEELSITLRQATLGAIIETIVDDTIAEKPEVTESEIHDIVDPLVEKAVALALIPSSAKQRVNAILAQRYRSTDVRTQLLERAACHITSACATLEDDAVISTVLDTEPADDGTDVTNDMVEPTGDSIAIDGAVPTVLSVPMRHMIAADVNRRKATAVVIRRGAGVLLDQMLHDLRHHVPASFKKRYQLD